MHYNKLSGPGTGKTTIILNNKLFQNIMIIISM